MIILYPSIFGLNLDKFVVRLGVELLIVVLDELYFGALNMKVVLIINADALLALVERKTAVHPLAQLCLHLEWIVGT